MCRKTKGLETDRQDANTSSTVDLAVVTALSLRPKKRRPSIQDGRGRDEVQKVEALRLTCQSSAVAWWLKGMAR